MLLLFFFFVTKKLNVREKGTNKSGSRSEKSKNKNIKETAF